MKSQSKKSSKKLRTLPSAEVKRAFRWIDSLSEKEIAKFDQLARVQLAQILLIRYLENDRKAVKRKVQSKKKK